MTWDPLEKRIGRVVRHPRFGPIFKRTFFAFVALFAISLVTTPLDRVPGLKLLRSPFRLMHLVTQTKQNWSMFQYFPSAESKLVIHSGHISPLTNQFSQQETVGPILPGLKPIDPYRQRRAQIFFQDILKVGGSPKPREYYFRQLQKSLEQRYAGSDNPPTHFVLELTSAAVPDLKTTTVLEPITHRLGPLPIGQSR